MQLCICSDGGVGILVAHHFLAGNGIRVRHRVVFLLILLGKNGGDGVDHVGNSKGNGNFYSVRCQCIRGNHQTGKGDQNNDDVHVLFV